MRNAQAAMEFLMTYGWAILVVLAAIGALAYFGVLSPDRFLPSKCVANPPFSCGEFKVDGTADTLTFALQASAGVDLTDVSINFSCDGTVGHAVATTEITPDRLGTAGWLNGGESTIVIVADDLGNEAGDSQCDAAAAADFAGGDRVKGDFVIIYTKAGESVSHTSTGSLQARVE